MSTLRSVCVYCASSSGSNTALEAAATDLGRSLAAAGVGIVYGGGSAGLMGALAMAALDAGGHVTGVLPVGLFPDGVTASPLRDHHDGVFRLIETGSMHERKAMMASLADGFVALPGGFGTLEELAEIATWAQIGIHAKPVCVVDVDGYFDHFLAFLDRMVADGLLSGANRRLLRVASSVDDVLAVLTVDESTADPKWD